MPASIKLQEELGDEVQVIFVESQGATRDKAAAFAMRQKWLGTNAMWTDERMADSQSRGLPSFVLLGNEGQVLLRGNPLAMKKQIEEAIEEQIDLAKSAPEGTPSKLKKAWSEFGKGNLAKALAEAEKVREAGADDDELFKAAESTVDTFTARTKARIERVGSMMKVGEYVLAEELVDELAKALKGHDELSALVEEARGALMAEELAGEREAAAVLAKIEEKMAGKGGAEKQESSLEKLTEKHPGTQAAARAQRYLDLLAMEL